MSTSPLLLEPGHGSQVPLEGEPHLQVLYPEEVFLPWGQGDGEVGWIPPAEERQASGPASLAVDRDGSLWILDQVNSRLVHLDPEGEWLDSLDCPAGATDLAVGPEGRLHVLSLVNHRVTILDGDGIHATLPIPPALPHISGIIVNDRGHVLVLDSYQQTYDLGGPGIRMVWPSLMHTRREGVVTASGGPRVKAVLGEGGVELIYPLEDGDRTLQPEPPADRLLLPQTEEAASVVVLDSQPSGGAVLLLEWFQGEPVMRTLRRVDERGRPLAEVTLPSRPLAFPFREFAVGTAGAIHQLDAQADGLTIHTYYLGRGR